MTPAYMALAFLQNSWFKPGTPQRYIDMYRDDQRLHRRVLAMSRTGQYLRNAFGPMYDEIFWDNASPAHGFDHSARHVADIIHMQDVVKRLRPHVVLLFGGVARAGYGKISENIVDIPHITIYGPHPSARGNPMGELRRMAEELKRTTNHNG